MGTRSSVEIFDLDSRTSRVIWQTDALFEAPNWSPCGRYLLLNSEGRIYRLMLQEEPVVIEAVETSFAVQCNNDHGISPDGSRIAISDKTEFGKSAIYVLPAMGGEPR
ncbi:MAG TPA: hypothetical protein VFY63_02630, partial [Pseudorhizobium sp.]|nr:hypothetical protein [Pseudorhizobium sp.]